MPTPTSQTYTELQHAYDHFNTALFAGQLPPCLMTLQRKSRTYGYFSGDRWTNRTGATFTDEIAMNPAHFATRPVDEVLSTLAHEMVHLWQHHFGTPSRTGYHNKAWAAKMAAIGLEPSATGQPGGQRTGQRVSHYIRDGGPFHHACRALLDQGLTISWLDRAGDDDKAKKKANTRTKYTCPGCGLNAWAKPDIVLRCGACETALVAAEADDFGALSRFKIGDIVRHKQTPTLRFRVRAILEAVPRKAGNHLYECILVGMRPRTERRRVFKYHESDLLPADGSTEE